MDKPGCFKKCDCDDMSEEHCSNRDFPVMSKCVKCPFYFGVLEKKKASEQNSKVALNGLGKFSYRILNPEMKT